MFDLDKWSEIWKTITANKTRSVLTAFGVFWGLFMFILLVGFGNGFKKGITDELAGVSTNSCFIWTSQTSEPYKGYRKGRYWSMNSRDLAIIRERTVSVEYIAPMLYVRGTQTRGQKTGSYASIGVSPDYFQIQVMDPIYGRILNEIDQEQRRKVCVLGKEVYETLFDVGENPIGEYVKINSLYYRVVGVVQRLSGSSLGSNPDRTIYLPFATVQQTVSWGDAFWEMMLTAKRGFPVSDMQEEVKQILKANHDISPTDEKAVGGFNIEKEFEQMDALFVGISALVWVVGMGALFSGIIGISNIMLVTVRERTREIGVRRALGAKPVAIIGQIMSESFVLTAIAGMAGFLFGTLILTVIESVMTATPPDGEGLSMIPHLSFGVAMTAMGVLILSGLFAGLMPAMKALQIKAIDALRDE